MNCPICNNYNPCPSCNDWICQHCGSELKPDPETYIENKCEIKNEMPKMQN